MLFKIKHHQGGKTDVVAARNSRSFIAFLDPHLRRFLPKLVFDARENIALSPHLPHFPFLLCSSSKFAPGKKKETLWQPLCRLAYNTFMGGVDLADQLNGYYLTLHKAYNYFWRRVFEQKLMQACSNAWLLYKWWLADMLVQVNEEITKVEKGGYAEGTPERLQLQALENEQADLRKLQNKKRAQWLRALAMHLIAQSTLGRQGRGGRHPRKSSTPQFKKHYDRREHLHQIVQRRDCASPHCEGTPGERARAPKRDRNAKVSQACFCPSCSHVGGVVICTACHADDRKHEEAYLKTAMRARTPKATKRSVLEKK